jgi:hypothetical protein
MVEKYDDWTFIWEGKVFFLTDNYGHHSCEPRLTSVDLEVWESCGKKLEPREEEELSLFEDEEPLQTLLKDEKFLQCWSKHCESCWKTAEMHTQAIWDSLK